MGGQRDVGSGSPGSSGRSSSLASRAAALQALRQQCCLAVPGLDGRHRLGRTHTWRRQLACLALKTICICALCKAFIAKLSPSMFTSINKWQD